MPPEYWTLVVRDRTSLGFGFVTERLVSSITEASPCARRQKQKPLWRRVGKEKHGGEQNSVGEKFSQPMPERKPGSSTPICFASRTASSVYAPKGVRL
jgi:hypothetical protein